ncbi:MAG: isopeptide-forming domain-containing fimbrial protein, partial [Ruminococcus sp.]|nr:isopeptide-forming domain-containing fimbrial protein [Ruminococcus sp.]
NGYKGKGAFIMKNTKRARRAAAFAAAVVMAACAAIPMSSSFSASAEDTYSITINNDNAGHTYEAYQIFKGSLGADDVLGNIEWGDNVNSSAEGFLTAIQGIADKNGETPFTNLDTASAIAAKLGENNTDTTLAANFAQTIGNYLTDTPQVMQNVQTPDSDSDGKQEYVLNVTSAGYYLVKDKDTTQNNKNDSYTTFIMRVLGKSSATPKSAQPTVDKQVLDEEADAEAGNTAGWGESADHAINESFKFKLTATLSADENYGAYKTYKVVFHDTMSTGVTFESIDSVKIGNVDIPVSTENSDGYVCSATAGLVGNGTDEWTLTIADLKKYQADLTKGATVEVIYNAHLNESAIVSNASGTELGTNAANNNNVYLQYSNNPNVSGDSDLGQTPKDYVWVFTYKVDNKKVDQDGNVLAGAGFNLYSGDTEIGLIYDDDLTAYRPIKGDEVAVEMKSAATTGAFNIVGLDAGTYVLKETSTPAGYNTCAPITVEIGAVHKENADGTTVNLTLTQKNTDNTIQNQKGSTLPSTGGIGTTMFYVGGGVLVAGAGVLLITKKRAKKDAE